MASAAETFTNPSSVFADTEASEYQSYEASLCFTGWVMGGIPQKVDVIEGWLRKRTGIADTVEAQQLALRTMRELFPEVVKDDFTYEQAVAATEAIAEQHVNTFKRDHDGLYLEGRQVKAMLKEAINIRFPKERWGHGKGARNFAAERVFVEDEVISLGVQQPSGRHLFIGHVSDRSGERATLTYYDYVDGPEVEFVVKVQSTAQAELEKRWPLIWVTAEKNGLGALRSQGFGQFVITRWERM